MYYFYGRKEEEMEAGREEKEHKKTAQMRLFITKGIISTLISSGSENV